jgi:hypothetical protein
LATLVAANRPTDGAHSTAYVAADEVHETEELAPVQLARRLHICVHIEKTKKILFNSRIDSDLNSEDGRILFFAQFLSVILIEF